MKKFIIIGLWVVFTIGLFVMMGFATHAHGVRKCEALDIAIDRKSADLFIDNEMVEHLLDDHGMNPVGQELAKVDVNALERLLLTHPAVESCDAFVTVGGKVSIRIHQRRVIARFINATGESYYIDDRGLLMPWSEVYTAPVVLVNGNFADTYARWENFSFKDVVTDSVPNTPTVLDDAWQIVKRVDADTFLRSQVVQVYYSPEKGFQLTPRVGRHTIIVGDVSDLDEKFKKLLVFYREGLARTGRWNEYSMIDLQYKNQIVCTKKNN